MGGPEVKTSAELVSVYLRVAGRRKRLVELPRPGKAARAFREGVQICPDRVYGRVCWEEFLHDTFQRQRADESRRERVS